MEISQKRKTELLHKPTILLLGTYLKKRKKKNTTLKGYMYPIFKAALFTTASIWKQSKCPSTDEWIRKVKVKSPSHVWLCYPTDCSLPGSSVHGILQARILEWVAISFSRVSSQSRDQTWVSHIGGRCFNLWATREPLNGKEDVVCMCWNTAQP